VPPPSPTPGQAKDAAKLDDEERPRLRKQALDWLRADLAAWTKLIDRGLPTDRVAVQQKLKHWQMDSDLAGIRDATALANRVAEDRVAALLKKANEKQ
jgi:hypothetical protein